MTKVEIYGGDAVGTDYAGELGDVRGDSDVGDVCGDVCDVCGDVGNVCGDCDAGDDGDMVRFHPTAAFEFLH